MIIVLLPIPGVITKFVQKNQKIKMKKTDARIQMVTESMSIASSFVPLSETLIFPSNECVTHGEVLWMGINDER